jgi:hypothetical protein
MRRPNLDGMAITCVVIVGIFEAIQEALSQSPKVTDMLPAFTYSHLLNYVPLVLLIVAGLLWIFGRRHKPAVVATPMLSITYVQSSVQIQCHADGRWPTAIKVENIAGWYALRNTMTLFSIDQKTGTTTQQPVHSWSLFINFDVPTQYGQLVVDGGGAQLPPYEIKTSTQRYAIIAFNGDIGGMVLTVRTNP